jgi:hypothetical protein
VNQPRPFARLAAALAPFIAKQLEGEGEDGVQPSERSSACDAKAGGVNH